MKKLIVLLTLVVCYACNDSSVNSSTSSDAHRISLDSNLLDASRADVHYFEFIIPDAYADPCEGITSSEGNFCDCKPECCQRQMWYCPPSGLGVQASEVVMNICNDMFEVCDRSQDLTCPPNEVLSRSDCNTILQCPPGIENDITISVRCEIEGVEGQQQILCSKGHIEYGECIVCEPEEERCNYKDDDKISAITLITTATEQLMKRLYGRVRPHVKGG